ncbi:MAG: oxygen-independent coproporphyrinogen III oxidase [Bacteroidetes bacterium]|nr:oxygen-independent coproporphyrinogen III oxidase [Bacteroidota bacterium]
MQTLIDKYDIACPRYTSYPTVPYWENNLSQDEYKKQLKITFDESNDATGISLYIHLPFCESLCTYCGCNTRITVNHKVESPYIQSVLAEWNMYKTVFQQAPKIKELHLGGGTPTFFSPENLRTLIGGILEGCTKTADPKFSFEAHPANTTTAHLQVLFDLGFKRLSLGIQDFDPIVQETINRKQSFEEVQSVTEQARSIGYTSISYDVIYGLPFQTLQSIEDTFQKVARLQPDRISFYSYAHIPWKRPGQRKYNEADLPLKEYKRSLYEKGKEILSASGYQEIGMDHFALPHDELFTAEKNGKLHRNFMGYTDDKTKLLVGLGVSAISDTWTSFAQNIKEVESYQKAVSEGKLPITVGHHLNAEDLFIRHQILNIMCKSQTEWMHEELVQMRENGITHRLHELSLDDLIDLKHNSLSVTEKGKIFLRNICLAMDLRYWRKVPEKNTFSKAV